MNNFLRSEARLSRIRLVCSASSLVFVVLVSNNFLVVFLYMYEIRYICSLAAFPPTLEHQRGKNLIRGHSRGPT